MGTEAALIKRGISALIGRRGWRKLKEIQVDIHDISPDLLRPTLMTVYVPKKGCWVFSEETRLREEMGKAE